jgi:uncharacterized protein YggU (UPF0235/DUF167 family)
VAGGLDDVVKICVSQPAEHGRANKAVRKVLARMLRVPDSSIRIISGQTSNNKVVEIVGLEQMQLLDRLPVRSSMQD